MAQIGIRDYLKQQGVKDNEIGYQSGNVTVGGKNFMAATPGADNRTYSTQDELTKAFGAYQNQKRMDTITQRNEGLFGEVDGLKKQVAQPPKQFSYDPQSDPQYQAALNQARMNSMQAAGNIAADMNKRGLLNSTITADRGNQAAQQEYSRVSDTVLPQLMQQAYQRHTDEQNQQRMQMLDQLGLIESQYGMVKFDRDVFENDRNYDRDVFVGDRSFDEGVRQFDQNYDRGIFESDRSHGEGVRQFDQNYNRGVLESDRNYNRGVLESNRSFGLQSDQEERLTGNQGLDNLYRQWEATGKAPEGIPGVMPGTPLFDRVAARQDGGEPQLTKIDAKTSTNNYNMIMSDLNDPNITRDEAFALLSANADYLTDSDYRKINDYIFNDID